MNRFTVQVSGIHAVRHGLVKVTHFKKDKVSDSLGYVTPVPNRGLAALYR